MIRARPFLAALLPLFLTVTATADEVDDVLVKRTKNRDKVQRMSGEWTVTTKQPDVNGRIKDPKTLKMKYRLKLEKLPPQARKGKDNPWRVNAEVLEPHLMNMKVEGDQAWFQDQHGDWVELPMTGEHLNQFATMGERFLGEDPQKQRQHYTIKVLRRNNKIFGPSTTTLEFTPKGKGVLFARMEQDVDADSLALETRLFDESGRKTMTMKVTKSKKINGIPMIEIMDTTTETAAGTVESRMEARDVVVE